MRLKYYSLDNLAQSKTCADQNLKKRLRRFRVYFFSFLLWEFNKFAFFRGGVFWTPSFDSTVDPRMDDITLFKNGSTVKLLFTNTGEKFNPFSSITYLNQSGLTFTIPNPCPLQIVFTWMIAFDWWIVHILNYTCFGCEGYIAIHV